MSSISFLYNIFLISSIIQNNTSKRNIKFTTGKIVKTKITPISPALSLLISGLDNTVKYVIYDKSNNIITVK